MRPSLTAEMADMVVQDRIVAAERYRLQREVTRLASLAGRLQHGVAVVVEAHQQASVRGQRVER